MCWVSTLRQLTKGGVPDRLLFAGCKEKVKVIPLQAGVTQRVGRGIALLFHDRGTTRGWVVSSTPRPNFTPGKNPVPILQEAGWAPGPVWTGGKSRPHLDSILDRAVRSQSLYRLSYPAHNMKVTITFLKGEVAKFSWILRRLTETLRISAL